MTRRRARQRGAHPRLRERCANLVFIDAGFFAAQGNFLRDHLTRWAYLTDTILAGRRHRLQLISSEVLSEVRRFSSVDAAGLILQMFLQ